jgi:hypothetical protein
MTRKKVYSKRKQQNHQPYSVSWKRKKKYKREDGGTGEKSRWNKKKIFSLHVMFMLSDSTLHSMTEYWKQFFSQRIRLIRSCLKGNLYMRPSKWQHDTDVEIFLYNFVQCYCQQLLLLISALHELFFSLTHVLCYNLSPFQK